uniref:nucleoside deaminase n=1 Tax=Alistipes sp. TaxID=1872444 RepID=UPI004056F4B2
MHYTEQDKAFMQQAIELANASVKQGGGPFGAVIVRDGELIARGSNSVTLLNDPTAHAEVQAIRAACQELKSFELKGCVVYTSCEPCPMCLSALYWAGVERIYYANTRDDAAAIGFDDSLIYTEIPKAPLQRRIPAEQFMREEALESFRLWEAKEDKVEY